MLGPHFTTHHQARFPRSACLTGCSVSGLGFLPGISICSVSLSILFQLIYSNRLKCEGLRAGNIMFYSNRCDSFKQRAPRLHFRCIPCLHPSYFSRLKWYLPAYRTNSFCRSASTDKAADPLGSKSVHLRVASFHSSPPRLCPTVSSPFTGRI